MTALKVSRSELPRVKIVNVISSTKADRPLDIELLTTKLTHTVYEPEFFPGLIYRRREPKATIIMFSTGKVASIGSKSEEMARKSIRITTSEIQQIEGRNISIGEITTENVVAISDTGRSIDVQKAVGLAIKATYEPEQFPGVIYHVKNSLTVLIFGSGKILSVGSRSETEAVSAIHDTYKMLEVSGCFL